MKISIESINYCISFDNSDLKLKPDFKELREIEEKIKAIDGIISSKIRDHGLFIWIDISVSEKIHSDQLLTIVKNLMSNYLN